MMTKKKDLPAMPSVFLSSSAEKQIVNHSFEEQLRFTTGIVQKQTVQLLNYFAKHHGCIHEAAIIQGILSGFVTLFNSILEPTDDEAVRVMRLAAFEKLKEACHVIVPEVMEQMTKFYDQIIDITLRDQEVKDKDEPHVSITLDANVLYPASPAASISTPKPEVTKPATPAKWLN